MSDLLAALDALRERLNEIPQADERRLQELKTELLGRKAGVLTEILKALPALPPEERKRVGGTANALKRELEHAIDARESELKRTDPMLSSATRRLRTGRPSEARQIRTTPSSAAVATSRPSGLTLANRTSTGCGRVTDPPLARCQMTAVRPPALTAFAPSASKLAFAAPPCVPSVRR